MGIALCVGQVALTGDAARAIFPGSSHEPLAPIEIYCVTWIRSLILNAFYPSRLTTDEIEAWSSTASYSSKRSTYRL
jgi:hypothetical protein